MKTSTASHPQLLSPTTPETFATSSDAVLSMPPVAGRVTEISKPEIPSQQGRQFSSVPSVSNYQGLGVVPQSQYLYETAEPQPQEISRSNFVVWFLASSCLCATLMWLDSTEMLSFYYFSNHSQSQPQITTVQFFAQFLMGKHVTSFFLHMVPLSSVEMSL